MKSIIGFLLVILFLSNQIYSQVEIPLLNDISGKWHVFKEKEGGVNKEIIISKWILNHNFFEINLLSEQVKNSKNGYTETAKEVLTLNSDNSITGYSIDSYGISHMVSITGTINANTITLKGVNTNSECTIIYELNDNRLTRKSDWKIPTGENIKSEITYNRIGSDFKQSSLSTKYDNISGPGLAYVCHLSEEFVTVFDTKTNELVGKIPCGQNSDFISLQSSGNKGYITNYGSGSLTIFDRLTNETIATVDAGGNPTFLLSLKDKVLISHQSEDGIWVMDANTNKIVKKLKEGTGPMYFIENENKIYQPQIFTPYLYVIDPATLEITNRIKTDGRPMEMAFTENQKFGYMVNYDLNEVTKYDTKTDNVLTRIKDVNHPRGIASSPDGKLVYVSDVVAGKVHVISTETDAVTVVISGFMMPVSIAFTGDGKLAYVLNQADSSISIVDTKENKIIKTLNVAGNPISILVDAR
jgi:YVTN family beta-propeller protein